MSNIGILPKGGLLTSDGSNNNPLPVGLDTFVLTADSAQPDGIKWAAPGGAGPAFQAYLSGSQYGTTGDGTSYNIPFNETFYDTGSNFDKSTGIYTAPTTGIYLFTGLINLILSNALETEGSINFVTTGGGGTYNLYSINPYVTSNSGGLVLPFSIQTKLTAGDTVLINIIISGGSLDVQVFGHLNGTNFAGTLLFET